MKISNDIVYIRGNFDWFCLLTGIWYDITMIIWQDGNFGLLLHSVGYRWCLWRIFPFMADTLKAPLVARRYIVPFVLISSLFFTWGFARSVLDVLNKHLQDSLSISVTSSTLVQGATYVAYALMAFPAGLFITRLGYRAGLVAGLGLFAVGAFLFIPGAEMMSFGLFLVALFIIGCGLAILETSANPYAAELGDTATSAGRLNLAQAFNGLGCILGPVTVGGYLFSGHASVALPYTVMGIFVVIMALLFCRVKLPTLSPDESLRPKSTRRAVRELWSDRGFRWGIAALFSYEIAEIGINSLFINYAVSDGWLDPTQAATVLSFGALGLFMLARVVGSAVMSRVSPMKVLRICGLVAALGALEVATSHGWQARLGLFLCYAFESIIFPTIFALTISRSGANARLASSFMMMTPLGGAVGTILMGWTANWWGMSQAFVIPFLGYTVVILYVVFMSGDYEKHPISKN